MVNIAICDDNKIFCSSLEKILSNYNKFDINIQIFNQSKLFCNHIKEYFNFDIIFLDIEFTQNDFNGVQVGNFIRNELHNNKVQIVYISANEEYSLQLFEFRPMNFLIKPITEEKVFKILDTFAKINDKHLYVEYFEFECNSEINRIPIDDIMYFYSNKHSIGLRTHDNTNYLMYGKLNDIQSNLLFKDFVSIHKSFFINLDYVLKYSYTEIQMQNKEILPISRANRKDVHQQMIIKTFGKF